MSDNTPRLLGDEEQFHRYMETAADNFRRVGAEMARIGRAIDRQATAPICRDRREGVTP